MKSKDRVRRKASRMRKGIENTTEGWRIKEKKKPPRECVRLFSQPLQIKVLVYTNAMDSFQALFCLEASPTVGDSIHFH